MDIFYAFSTDNEAAEAGRDFPLGGGVSLRIAKLGNKAFVRKRQDLVAEAAAEGDMTDEVSDKLLTSCMAHTVLVGWSGPLAFKGRTLEYSPESAELLLGVPEFRDLVLEVSGNPDNFRVIPG